MSRRLIIVIHSLSGGGAERVTANLATGWVERGYEVRVLTFVAEDKDPYPIPAEASVVRLDLARVSNSLGHTLWNNFLRLRAIRQEILTFKPQAVIGVMTPAAILVGLSTFGTAARSIGCEHTFAPIAVRGPLRTTVRRATYRLLDAVVALTNKSAAWLREETSARTVRCIPNPITWPIPSFDPYKDPRAVIHPRRKVLLAVGRLVALKNFDQLIRIFSKIANELSDWDLVILGEGPERTSLESLRETLGMNRQIFLPGRVGNVGDWYDAADICALTSDHEGLPGALIEGMASGLPAVSVDCDDGPRDIIDNGVDGFLVPPGDASGFKDRLALLMTDDELRFKMGQAARSVREKFSEERVFALWEELFDSLAPIPRR